MLCISIIIPYFNRENTIQRCLDSIDLEENTNVEVIIVDDCSHQPLGDFGNSSITVIRLESNMGPVAARSHGAMKAKNDYLMFLDSDDELLPGWCDLLREVIRNRPGYDIYGFSDEKYGKGQNFDILSTDEYWKWVPLDSRASDYMLVITAGAYGDVMMPKLRISEIWYIVQLFEFGQKAHYSEKPIFRYHQDAGNQLSKRKYWHLDTSDYTRESLHYSIVVFKRNESRVKRCSGSFRYAWYKRFFKESLLSLSITGLVCLIFGGRNGTNKPPGDRR